MSSGLQLRTVESVADQLKKIGDVDLLKGDTFRDTSTIVVIPTRGLIHPNVVQGWLTLARPLNQKHAVMLVSGDEVGVAYNRAIATVLDDPKYDMFKYVLTLEDDNLVPSHALLLLLQTIKDYDAVGGLYHMKGGLNVPMAFGTPGAETTDGDIDMAPRDLTDAILEQRVEPVNGLACGCTLWRLDLFRKVERPWFTTWTRFRADDTVEVMTQDIYFCRKALAVGAKFAIDTRVKVGHLDVKTGQVY